MSILTKIAIGNTITILLTMYGIYLYMWLANGNNIIEVVIHHVVVIFMLSVLYLIGLGIYKAWKAATR